MVQCSIFCFGLLYIKLTCQNIKTKIFLIIYIPNVYIISAFLILIFFFLNTIDLDKIYLIVFHTSLTLDYASFNIYSNCFSNTICNLLLISNF